MRIRKSLLSLSAATPPPASDPQLHPYGNLSIPLDDANHSQPFDPPPPPDYTEQIGVAPHAWVSSGAGSDANDPFIFHHKELELEGERERGLPESNYTGSKERILGAQASGSVGSSSLSPPLTTSDLVLKGWFEGDRLIPIKKRRGRFMKREKDTIEGSMKPEIDDKATNEKKRKKNAKRGNVIMAGSRCSRVNGRGWRCCQQTLVGYSLCEHHLGKGRVRSLKSVRGRTHEKVAPKQEDVKGEDVTNYNEFDDDEDDEFAELEGEKKRKKLGFVKARSLRSLLGQIGS